VAALWFNACRRAYGRNGDDSSPSTLRLVVIITDATSPLRRLRGGGGHIHAGLPRRSPNAGLAWRAGLDIAATTRAGGAARRTRPTHTLRIFTWIHKSIGNAVPTFYLCLPTACSPLLNSLYLTWTEQPPSGVPDAPLGRLGHRLRSFCAGRAPRLLQN